MDKDPMEQETLARGIGNELTEIFVRFVRGEVDLRAERSKSGEGAIAQAQASGRAPHPDSFAPLRFARNPTSPRTASHGGGRWSKRIARARTDPPETV